MGRTKRLVLKDRKERIEKEERELNMKLEKARLKHEGWKLYSLCKEFLETNNKFWKKRREQQLEENNRNERLEKARAKARETRTRIENKEWEQRLEEGLEKVPLSEREQAERTAVKQEKLELKKAKENLWKLRNKENKLIQTKRVLEIKKLEQRTEQVLELLEKEKK